jgi:hypothetical protein
MTTSPTFQVIKQTEIQRLYAEHGIEEKLLSCESEELPVPYANLHDKEMHEGFCCKKRILRYFDPISHCEIALISHVTPTPPNQKEPHITISRLRLGDIVYEASLPSS